MNYIAFDFPAPSAEEIEDLATRFCGLRVCASLEESDRCNSEMYEFSFEGFSGHSVSVYRYERGAFVDYTEKYKERAGDTPAAEYSEGVQFIEVAVGLAGSELTLGRVLVHVLELESGHNLYDSGDVSDLLDLTPVLMRSRYDESENKQKRRAPFYVLVVILWFFCILCILAIPAWLIVKILMRVFV